ncbi:DUF4197 domain-containing protein [Crocinitomicaceae bacterium]|jgi:hypothetical protein|nr:DUF4197 domain-containing protein [Crocinitomicaceae bacterium]
MKKTITIVFASALLFASCDVVNNAANQANNIINSGSGETDGANPLTNVEVISGLREALNIGIENSVKSTSIQDGFLKNTAIRLPFPPDAEKVKQKALDLGLDGQVEKFETTLNRAAEEASKEALSIFINAIKNMTVQDGFAILNGGNGAATEFLKKQTKEQLKEAFLPKVKVAISNVKLTDYWNPLITKYNTAMTLTGGQKLNPDLDQFVTDKAIEGLFHMVEKEEDKIRLDPLARVTDLLTRVFGSLNN